MQLATCCLRFLHRIVHVVVGRGKVWDPVEKQQLIYFGNVLVLLWGLFWCPNHFGQQFSLDVVVLSSWCVLFLGVRALFSLLSGRNPSKRTRAAFLV